MTTDTDACVMKASEGGIRPASNVWLATADSEDEVPRAIVVLRVTNVGSDIGSVAVMLEDI